MEDDKMLLDALDNLPVSELERADWIAVGMALKAAGYGVDDKNSLFIVVPNTDT